MHSLYFGLFKQDYVCAEHKQNKEF